MRHIELSIQDNIAWIKWSQPESKVNVLSEEALKEFSRTIDQLPSSVQVAVVISKKPSVFIAGADIKEIQSLKTKEAFAEKIQRAYDIFAKMEKSSTSFIAAIHGACLGGGLELALACDYRIATNDPSTKIGFPEVNLGLIPGFGGTVRLPRLVGFFTSLNLIVQGNSLSASKAHKIGLIHQVENIPSLLDESAKTLAQKIISGQKKPKTLSSPPYNLESFFKRFISFIFRRQVIKKTKGFYPAPLKAISHLKKIYSWSLPQALEEEKKTFCDLAVTEESRHLVRLFFLMEEAKKKGSISSIEKPIQSVGVLGAGVMGSGIAYTSADRGFSVRLQDIQKESLVKAQKSMSGLWKKQKKRRRITSFEMELRKSRVSYSVDSTGFSKTDLMIEAVVENMGVKKQVIQKYFDCLSDSSIFASNTSSLSVNQMASFCKDPSRFVGLHFFNPVYRMPLVEVIQGDKTSDETVNRVLHFVKKIGKTPVLVKDRPGFLVNRLLMPWLSESLWLLTSGLRVRTVDRLFLKFGWPMGPFRLMDEVGLDVCVSVIQSFQSQGLKIDTPSFVDQLAKKGSLGKKDLKGFYHYTDKGQPRSVNSDLEQLCLSQSLKSSVSPEEALKKGIYRMINEAAAVLEEGVVREPSSVDIAMILGAGFPPFRGGLLRYADSVGLKNIVESLELWESQGETRFTPSPLLKKKILHRQSFYS